MEANGLILTCVPCHFFVCGVSRLPIPPLAHTDLAPFAVNAGRAYQTYVPTDSAGISVWKTFP